MSWHYLQEQEGESSGACCSGGEPLPPLRSKTTHAEFFSNGRLTASYLDSLSGTMCEPSTANPGAEKSMSSRGGFLARTSALPEKEQESPASDPGYGLSFPASSARFDRPTSSWKIHPCLFPEDSMSCSPTLPKWGTMRNGVLSDRITPSEIVAASASGLLPAPQARDGKGFYRVRRESAKRRGADGRQKMLIHVVAELKGWPDWSVYVANPPFWEAVMNWPIQWTDFRPLETGKIQQWLRSHGEH